MNKSPESFTGGGEDGESINDGVVRKIGEVALQGSSCAVDLVEDHFPDDISPKEHFERGTEPNPLNTEEDYRKMFDLFRQERLIPIQSSNPNDQNKNDIEIRPYRETANVYIDKTEKLIKKLVGEDEKLPQADVVIYLDKSARPVSWFVDEFWEDFTDKPRPRKEHLAIDRKAWFKYFDVELEIGEYVKGSGELATWDELPIQDVKKEDIEQLRWLLKNEVITHEELENVMNRDAKTMDRIKGRAIDTVLKENNVQERIAKNEITRQEYESYITEALESIKILDVDHNKLRNINEVRLIVERLRGLFVPGGLSEEEVTYSEKIMDRETGLEGKNIVIIDEVARTGATGKVAEHFISWAFPEARSVSFDVFFDDNNNRHPTTNQMLMIPFWYSLVHDDGAGRGINGVDQETYKRKYERQPNNINRAADFGSLFLGVKMDYEAEEGKKSLRLREQIAKLRVEYEKGHIN